MKEKVPHLLKTKKEITIATMVERGGSIPERWGKTSTKKKTRKGGRKIESNSK